MGRPWLASMTLQGMETWYVHNGNMSGPQAYLLGVHRETGSPSAVTAHPRTNGITRIRALRLGGRTAYTRL